jgi:predicted HNH restriction endonuclease
MIQSRTDLIKQRRETSMKTKKQKDDLNKLMEEVRTDASKANKIINLALKGAVSLKSVMSIGGERSSTGKPKKKKKGEKSNKEDKNRGHAHTAGEVQTSSNMGDSMKFDLDDGQANPKPYVSPYETSGVHMKSQKVTL